MTAQLPSLATPPGATPHRAASHVHTRLTRSLVALGAGLVILAVLLLTLRALWDSFVLDGWEEAVAAAVLLAIAVAGLSVPLAGARAVRHSLRARSLAAAGQASDARIAAEDAKESASYVLGLGLTSLIVSFLAGFMAANGGIVRATFFDWEYFWNQGLLEAFWLNVRIFLVAEVFVLIWGLVVALARMLPGRAGAPVRFLAVVYTDLFRGMPAIMTIYLVVFGIGLADLPLLGELSREQERFWLPVLALTLVYGAYVAEVYRAGLDSIHWSQTAGARSLGLSHTQTMRFVVVPQAVRRIVPPLLNDFIGLQKDTALLAFVGVVEVFNYSTLLKARYFNLTPVVAAGLMFVVITVPMARFVDYLIRRDQQRMLAGG